MSEAKDEDDLPHYEEPSPQQVAEQQANMHAAALASQNMQRQLQHYSRVNEMACEYVGYAEVLPQGGGLVRFVICDHPIGVPGSLPTPHHLFIMRTDAARAFANAFNAMCEIVDQMDARKPEVPPQPDATGYAAAEGKPN
jgi:hypothetical protein